MINIDFSAMSLEELEHLSATAYKEVALRKQKMQEKEWRDLVQSIKNYVDKYGEITVTVYGDEYVLHDTMDFDTPGEIRDIG